MKRYEHRTRLQAPLSAVARFHSDSRALKLLTPPPVFVQIHRAEPLGEGSQTEFTMWMGPLPVRWLAVHCAVDPLRGFTDSQERGPFTVWVHRHSFEPLGDDGCEIVDRIEAEPGKHPFWGLVSWFMWLNLPFMFAYRGWVLRRKLEH